MPQQQSLPWSCWRGPQHIQHRKRESRFIVCTCCRHMVALLSGTTEELNSAILAAGQVGKTGASGQTLNEAKTINKCESLFRICIAPLAVPSILSLFVTSVSAGAIARAIDGADVQVTVGPRERHQCVDRQVRTVRSQQRKPLRRKAKQSFRKLCFAATVLLWTS